ncbi:histidine phosphatase family protein [Halomarina ordinaria]|uniref:Histidine phosphatase family protein n=1 Tax=Halomarina ordinaria TaxID=3033939 RepID=A0ABD5U986_9EURY|nr:histidine phosphatase family protein [Halomarina sp. PSRA2]
MATVILMRHGETTWNRDRRMQGWAPVPLTDRGREQARAAGAHVAEQYDVDRVVVSDLHRTVETARHVNEVGGLDDVPRSFTDDWRERGVGVYQGLDYDTMRERFPNFALGEEAAYAHDETPEGGESLAGMRERVLDGWDAVAGGAGTTLVVTHGGPIQMVLGHLKGMDLPESVLTHHLDNCCLNEIRVDEEARLQYENATPWTDEEPSVGGRRDGHA